MQSPPPLRQLHCDFKLKYPLALIFNLFDFDFAYGAAYARLNTGACNKWIQINVVGLWCLCAFFIEKFPSFHHLPGWQHTQRTLPLICLAFPACHMCSAWCVSFIVSLILYVHNPPLPLTHSTFSISACVSRWRTDGPPWRKTKNPSCFHPRRQ